MKFTKISSFYCKKVLKYLVISIFFHIFAQEIKIGEKYEYKDSDKDKCIP